MSQEKDTWVEAVLQSTDGIQRLQAPPGFYEKTLARLAAAQPVSRGYVLGIAAAVTLLAALNVFACTSFSNSGNRQNIHLHAFAAEYNLNAPGDNF